MVFNMVLERIIFKLSYMWFPDLGQPPRVFEILKQFHFIAPISSIMCNLFDGFLMLISAVGSPEWCASVGLV